MTFIRLGQPAFTNVVRSGEAIVPQPKDAGTPIVVGTGKYWARGHNVDGLAVSNVFNIAVSI